MINHEKSNELCPFIKERDGRRVIGKVAMKLADLDIDASPPEITALPTVAHELGVAVRGTEKYDRAAKVAGLEFSHAIKEVVVGDGPQEAHFKEVPVIPPTYDIEAFPYRLLNDSIRGAFSIGWENYSSAHPEWAAWVAKVNKDAQANDASAYEASKALDRDSSWSIGVEAGPTVAYFSLFAALARGKDPALRDMASSAFREVIDELTLPYFRRLTGQNIIPAFNWREYYLEVQADEVTFGEHERSGKRSLRLPTEEALSDDPAILSLVTSPTVGCFLNYIKIQPTDTYTALENVIWAGINLIEDIRDEYDIDLFDPDTAQATWDRIQALETALMESEEHLFSKLLYKICGNLEEEAVEKVTDVFSAVRHEARSLII